MLPSVSGRFLRHALIAREFSDKCPPPPSAFTTNHVVDMGKPAPSTNKISVIGVGQVGIACSVSLLCQRLTSHLVMVDVRREWISAEATDLLHGSATIGSPKIDYCTDGTKTKDSKFIIVTAGFRPKPGQSRLEVAQASAELLVKALPNIVKHSPKATFVICSNPADVMTWVVQKFLKIPKSQCISAGCHLDSLRFRYYISKRLNVSPAAVHGFIIGEHGFSAVPVWSTVTVGGVLLSKAIPNIGTLCDEEKWALVHKDVIESGMHINKVKSYTNWGIALSVSDIIRALKENNGRILSVGTDMQGIMCIEESIVLSLPCILGSNGIEKVIELKLTDFEKELFMKSAETLLNAQCTIKMPPMEPPKPEKECK